MDENNNLNEQETKTAPDTYGKPEETDTVEEAAETVEEETKEEPVAEDSVAEEPVAEDSVAEDSATEEPAAPTEEAPVQETYTATYEATSTVTSEPEEIPTGFGIASLILGIISIFSCCCAPLIICAILGLIFGIIQPKNSEGKKPGVAVAGIICSCVGMLSLIFWIIYYLITGATSIASLL